MCNNRSCSYYEKHVSKDTFHYISIKDQLVETVKFFYPQILKKKLQDNISFDITNSSFYKSVNPDSEYLSLLIYSDGVQLRKNNKNFWPVFIGLCELPLALRDSKHNKIIAGKFFNI